MSTTVPKNMQDPYAWSKETVEALRAGDFSRIDMEALINETESVGNGIFRELVSFLRSAIQSIYILSLSSDLKLKHEAEYDLDIARIRIDNLFHTAPSVRQALDEAIEEAYPDARESVEEEFRVTLPATCPFPSDFILKGEQPEVVRPDDARHGQD